MYVSATSSRFSRGRSTPTRRAIARACPSAIERVRSRRSRAPPPHPPAGEPRPPCRGWSVRWPDGWRAPCSSSYGWCVSRWLLALALLVAQVLADHHDPAVAADHLALVAHGLDARLDLHDRSGRLVTCTGRRCGRGT